MKTPNRILTGVGLAAMTGAGLAGLYRLLLRQPLTPLDGVVAAPNLDLDVEIVRDEAGVPHIYAATSRDLYYALGYVHAQDRLWHMEFNRRLGRGTLAEIFGEPGLGYDRFMRRLGWKHVAAAEAVALEQDERAALDAYVAGINTFLTRHRWRLPLEFRILRFQPRPWEIVDVLAFGKVMSWLLSSNWDNEWFRAQILDRCGPEVAAQVERGYPEGQPLVIPAGVSYTGLSDSLLVEFQEAQRALGVLTGGMSNAWAVRPEKSTTGAAVLASDPHLLPQMPAIWYEAHLCGDGLDVSGVTMPGLPAVLIGHNAHIAWGVTVSMVDTQDLFVEQIDPTDTSRYKTPSGWEPLKVRLEEIQVRGRAEPVVEEVQETRHGPSLTPLLPGETRFLAIQSPVLGAQQTVRGAMRLHRANNWGEFRNALSDWGVSLNFVYADDEGNIGYQLSGQVPRRQKGTGLLPAPGWDANYDWAGFLPFDELPNAFNPPSGYVVSANNRLVGDDYPHHLTHDWIDGFRAMRIESQLQSREQHSPDDFAAMHLDFYSEAARQIIELLANLEPTEPMAVRAVAHLHRWDYRLTPESIPATIYVELKRRLLHNAFGPKLGPLTDAFIGDATPGGIAGSAYPARVTGFLIDLLRQADPAWLAGNSSFSTWTELKQASLDQAMVNLRARLGDDMDTWQWGRLHQVRFDHILGRVKPLDRIFNRGPYPMGGDDTTPCQSALSTGSYDAGSWIPSYRQIVDLGNLAASRSIHTTGQSGHPGSPHFDDFIPSWRRGHYHPMRYDRRDILDHLAHMLVLRPV